MTVHRLRDLDRNGRVVAAAFGAALLLAPLLAFGRYLPDWFPSGDPAWMGLQSLEVGTRHTPLIGQVSLSDDYVADQVVHHLGATHFYLMAPFVRTLGVSPGMLLVSVMITGGCLLVAAWTVFRHFGPAVGAGAAVVLGLVSFTTGASSLVNPVSSSIAGYPFLCSMFLLVALLLGDLRLLPLTTAVVSFTALQHLSVLPSLAVATALAVGGCVLRLARGTLPRPDRREAGRWLAISAGVGFVLWLPVLLQNVFGDEPNLNALVEFTRSSERPKLGYSTAVRHVAHVLGAPPALGRTDISGEWLFTRVSVVTGVTAGGVLVVLGFAVWRWNRAGSPRLVLAMMALVVALAGLVGSATVPRGHEQTRLVFYHWVFPLAALVALVVGLLVVEVVGRVASPRPAWFVAGALVVVVGLAVVNPFLDRWTNSLQAAYAPFERDVLGEFADEVADHEAELGDDATLVAGASAANAGLDPALLLQLRVRGVDVDHAHAEDLRPGGELASSWSDIDKGLVLVLDTEVRGWGRPSPPRGGELIAEQELPDGIVLRANVHRDLSRDQPATLELYLVDRGELRTWLRA